MIFSAISHAKIIRNSIKGERSINGGSFGLFIDIIKIYLLGKKNCVPGKIRMR